MSKKKRALEPNFVFFAGLYTRVARQAGVHPSYVSRVARGERRSEQVSRAIADELAQFVPSREGRMPAFAGHGGSRGEYRQRLIARLKAHLQLIKLRAIVIELEGWGRPKERPQVSRLDLQARIASNAPMMAAGIEHFHRMSRKLETSPHVLSLSDNDGVILYSLGAIVQLHEERRVPGADWGDDHEGPSAAARAIASRVPVIMVGKAQHHDGLLPVRMACPIRVSDGEVVGAVVLSIEFSPARAEHLIEIAKMARKICKIVEFERKKRSPDRVRKKAQVNAKAHGA